MTQVVVEGFGWVYIVVLLDWCTQTIVGYYAGMQGAARHWLAALDMAVNRQLAVGARGQGLALMSDDGGQPPAAAFMRACAPLGIHPAFASDHSPKGNADTERLTRTLTEGRLWLREWTCPSELMAALTAWLITYNEPYLHSALGYKRPKQCERDHDSSPSPLFLGA
jgi:putative transposase